jgi:ribulose-5-phosphate 4-epimerase/fuculose-1-phosphate aldolase
VSTAPNRSLAPRRHAVELAESARLISRAGLVEAFGHLSARLGGGGFLITPTDPLLHARPERMIEADDLGAAPADAGLPKEAPLHAAIYAARSDVGAICRTHSPAVVAWGARAAIPPLLHGLGGLSGTVSLHREAQLVTTARAARAAAADLGDCDCMILYANGAVCTAAQLSGAVVRAWFLEERARVAERCPDGCALPDAAASERAHHHEAEEARAWAWLRARFGEQLDPMQDNYQREAP